MAKKNVLGAFSFEKDFADSMKFLKTLSPKPKDTKVTLKAENGVLTVTFSWFALSARRLFTLGDSACFNFSVRLEDFIDIFEKFSAGTITVFDTFFRFKGNGRKMLRYFVCDMMDYRFPSFEGHKFIALPPDVFKFAALTSFATSESERGSRVSLIIGENKVYVCSSNGYRAVTVDAPIEFAGSTREYLLDPKLIESLAKLHKKNEETEVFIASTNTQDFIKVGDYEICSGRFEVESVAKAVKETIENLSSTPSLKVTFSPKDVTEYAEETVLIREFSGKREPLVLGFDRENGLLMAGHKTGKGDFTGVFAAEFEGDVSSDFCIGFNPEYLRDAVKRLSEPTATLELKDGLKASLICEERDNLLITHLVLPVRIHEGYTITPYDDEKGGDTESVNIAAVTARVVENEDDIF